MSLTFFRVCADDGHFDALQKEWADQVARYEPGTDGYESVRLQHAAQIVAENPPDKTYGIWVVMDESHDAATRYMALVHVNHAWPRTKDATLRMVWILLAPIYDYQDVDPIELADITGTILYGGLDLCQSEMKSQALKMHLGSSVDRSYATVIASNLRREMPMLKSAVRGNWLHMDKIAQRETIE